MASKYIMYFTLLLILSVSNGYAQRVNSVRIGKIKGLVKDSASNLPVPSATGTIYIGRDSVILTYLFTSNNGEFNFDALPCDTPLMFSLSHVGYKNFIKHFKIKSTTPEIDLGELLLASQSTNLKEVVITGQRPPIVMHGDTLEINAEAFKTKENAVVEDLLKKVPGIIVWADGKITVNGKSVNQLYVEGKPFFGGDPVVAIRNLPKEAINNIKVYKEKGGDQSMTANSQLIMDISLKQNKKEGFFGKVGAGEGTDKRYDGSGSINMFTPRTQMSAFAVTNNVNKEAYDVSSILKQSVYKPGGNDNSSYQSNYYKNGLNTFRAAGFNFNKDFTQELSLRNEYFTYNSDNKTVKSVQSSTALNNGYLKQQNDETNNGQWQSHRIYSSIDKISKKYEFHFTPVFELLNTKGGDASQLRTADSTGLLLNKNKSETSTQNESKKLNINAEYNNKGYGFNDFRFKYNIELDYYRINDTYITDFDTYNPNGGILGEIKFNRSSESTGSFLNQSIYYELNISKVLGFIRKVNPRLINTTTLLNQADSRRVNNYNGEDGLYNLKNTYLSNTSSYHLLQEKPGLQLGGSSVKELRNRYNKIFSYSALLELQMLSQVNHSEKIFQSINRNYTTLLPSFSLRYNHGKNEAFDRSYSLNYNSVVELPTVNQLVPLIDSANQSYVIMGNDRLKKQYKHEVKMSFSNTKVDNGGTLGINLTVGIINNKFVDSSFYDNAGRRISYTANKDGYKYASLDINYIRSTKLFKKPLGLFFFSVVNFSAAPYYLDNKLNNSQNLYSLLLAKSNYTFNDLFQFDLDGSISYYRNVYTGTSAGSHLSLVSRSISPTLQLMWPKHVTLVNGIIYNVDGSSYTKSIDALIWNAGLYYRLLKKENLELKFTATDLLRQRKNVISYVNNNTISLGRTNNLQQFFMVTVAYFPRQFGSNKNK